MSSSSGKMRNKATLNSNLSKFESLTVSTPVPLECSLNSNLSKFEYYIIFRLIYFKKPLNSNLSKFECVANKKQ